MASRFLSTLSRAAVLAAFLVTPAAIASAKSAGISETAAGGAEAVEPALVLGKKHTFSSKILGEDRPYLVHLPESYDHPAYSRARYPVLYLLAGNFQLATALTDYMSASLTNQIPEVIVIAIPISDPAQYHGYLTPTHSLSLHDGEQPPVLASSGGGDKFLEFLEAEFIPHIDSTYQTLPYRVLAGHSLAGLFSLHAFLAEPSLFQAHLAIDPSLWWDEQVLVERLNAAVAHRSVPDGDLYIALATRPREDESLEPMNGPGREFARLLTLHGSPRMHLKLQEFPNEHHVSVAPLALYHGFRHIFEGFEAAPGQFAERPETIIPHFEALSARRGVQILPPESLLDGLGHWELQKASTASAADPEQIAKAIELLEANVRFYPQSYHAHESLARAYEVQQHTTSALKHYERSLKLNPDNEAVRVRLLRLRQEH